MSSDGRRAPAAEGWCNATGCRLDTLVRTGAAWLSNGVARTGLRQAGRAAGTVVTPRGPAKGGSSSNRTRGRRGQRPERPATGAMGIGLAGRGGMGRTGEVTAHGEIDWITGTAAGLRRAPGSRGTKPSGGRASQGGCPSGSGRGRAAGPCQPTGANTVNGRAADLERSPWNRVTAAETGGDGWGRERCGDANPASAANAKLAGPGPGSARGCASDSTPLAMRLVRNGRTKVSPARHWPAENCVVTSQEEGESRGGRKEQTGGSGWGLGPSGGLGAARGTWVSMSRASAICSCWAKNWRRCSSEQNLLSRALRKNVTPVFFPHCRQFIGGGEAPSSPS